MNKILFTWKWVILRSLWSWRIGVMLIRISTIRLIIWLNWVSSIMRLGIWKCIFKHKKPFQWNTIVQNYSNRWICSLLSKAVFSVHNTKFSFKNRYKNILSWHKIYIVSICNFISLTRVWMIYCYRWSWRIIATSAAVLIIRLIIWLGRISAIKGL